MSAQVGAPARRAPPALPDDAQPLSLASFAAAALVWLAAFVGAEPLSQWLAYQALGLARDGRLGTAVAFFAYEAPKVLLLLLAVVFVIGIANSYFTAARTRRILAGRREVVGNALAALLGVVTPPGNHARQ